MLTEMELRQAVEQILREMGGQGGGCASGPESGGNNRPAPASSDDSLPDITVPDLKDLCYVPEPHNREALMAMKKKSPARLGVWRAGPRYLTETLLRFRADHAVAMDAVFTDVPDEWMAKNNLPLVQTKCESKDEYLTRPDLGRVFSPENQAKIKNIVGSNNRVVIFVADGLSSTAVETNAMDCLKAIVDGLNRHNIKPAAPFFVKYGRVGAEDAVSEACGCEVVCTLIGERPGLITAESMSAYIAYKATINMPEARRTVVSNIHKGGTPAVEAGGYIADLIKTMLDKKASGLDLKL